MDTAIHTLVSLLLLGLVGVFPLLGIPLLNAAVWFVREAEQEHAAGGNRWRPWTWSRRRNVEWMVPAAVGFIAFVVVALFSLGQGFSR